MTCFHPRLALRARAVSPNGKRKIVFRNVERWRLPAYEGIKLPCKRCIGCKLEYSRQWAIRIVHEAELYPQNCFITLTLNNYELQRHGPSLRVDYFQKFMKRFRKRFGNGIRFFHAGEYGEKFDRPHYHACIFNFDFPNKVLFTYSNGLPLYRSVDLEELWADPDTGIPFGYSTVGTLTFDSAAYVARYVCKKVNGKIAENFYKGRKPEYATMSRRNGIGYDWFKKYGREVYVTDSVVLRGREMRPPKYYDSLYEIECPGDYARLKKSREQDALKYLDNNTLDRLAVREIVQLSKYDKLVRTLSK